MSIFNEEIPQTFSVKDGEQLTFSEGWSDWLAHQLQEKTQQMEIQKWIPFEQDEVCFITADRAHRWYEHDAGQPIIISLGTASLELAGVAWITNMGKVNKGLGYQFGVRVYDGYREQKVGSELGSRIHRMFDEQRKGTVSYKMHVANQPAFATGIKLGYKMDPDSNSRELNMVRKRPPLL